MQLLEKLYAFLLVVLIVALFVTEGYEVELYIGTVFWVLLGLALYAAFYRSHQHESSKAKMPSPPPQRSQTDRRSKGRASTDIFEDWTSTDF